MSKFNTNKQGPEAIENEAGGTAYAQSPQLELASLLLTSFADDSFYRSGSETVERLKYLISKCDKEFVAKAIIYARTEFGMRSITHVASSELAKHVSGKEWGKLFFEKVIYRPDDITEILAYHKSCNGKIPNAMKNGFKNAFGKFGEYSLAKYKSDGKSFSLQDAVRICHPIPNEKNKEALQKLKDGKLASFDTWEVELSKAGQNAKTPEEKAKLKAEVWESLLRENKLGYFALLRNLRNIIEQAPLSVPLACEQLVNQKSIESSLVLPFRYLVAYDTINKMDSSKLQRMVQQAIVKAVDVSLNNVPEFEGETLVVLDTSQSMRNNARILGLKSPHVIGALFASAIAKKNNCDVLTFDESAQYVNLNYADSTLSLASRLLFDGGGTNFPSIFLTANKKYDRVIILSDMQGWIQEEYTPKHTYSQYKNKFKANPFIYSFDLQNYGTMQFLDNRVFGVAGFSEKIFDVMGALEKDKNAFLKEISKVNLK